ncbi:hypothetical protein QE152_g5689 [Popillia japonica]|uniref:Uncharacterized protein n=1 Tax=Popillia japonica TaxID=7064 RepID=A0AAW1MMF3_POPJA
MEINPSKSLSICATIVAGKSVVRTRPIFKVQGQFLPALGHLNTFRYLGLQFGSTGTAKPTLFHLRSWLSNLERTPLQPHQKLHMLKVFVIPRLYHGLQAPTTTGGLLVECDRLIRRTAKKILHLSAHTGSQFLHAAIRGGVWAFRSCDTSFHPS